MTINRPKRVPTRRLSFTSNYFEKLRFEHVTRRLFSINRATLLRRQKMLNGLYNLFLKHFSKKKKLTENIENRFVKLICGSQSSIA